jgi:hypothetical protein
MPEKPPIQPKKELTQETIIQILEGFVLVFKQGKGKHINLLQQPNPEEVLEILKSDSGYAELLPYIQAAKAEGRLDEIKEMIYNIGSVQLNNVITEMDKAGLVQIIDIMAGASIPEDALWKRWGRRARELKNSLLR